MPMPKIAYLADDVAKAKALSYGELREAMKGFVKEEGLRELLQCAYGAVYDSLKDQSFPVYELRKALTDHGSIGYTIERALAKAQEPVEVKTAE